MTKSFYCFWAEERTRTIANKVNSSSQTRWWCLGYNYILVLLHGGGDDNDHDDADGNNGVQPLQQEQPKKSAQSTLRVSRYGKSPPHTPAGIPPVKLFVSNSRVFNTVNWVISFGIEPYNLLSLTSRSAANLKLYSWRFIFIEVRMRS